MSIDYGEKEREFLDSLAADTGRDLASWMSAIAAANLTERNEIIDWLRHQGFMFSKASWLERIFNNGGKPIYGERGRDKAQERQRAPAKPRTPEAAPSPPSPPATPRSASPKAPSAPPPVPEAPVPEPPSVAAPAEPVRPEPQPTPVLTVPTAPSMPAFPAVPEASLEAALAKAKAFRPLASYLLAEIRKALPTATVEPYTNHIAILLEGTEAAVLAISPKDIRLLIAALGQPFDAGFGPAKMPQGLIGVRLAPTHMVTLTDARAITPALVERVREAALKSTGKA